MISHFLNKKSWIWWLSYPLTFNVRLYQIYAIYRIWYIIHNKSYKTKRNVMDAWLLFISTFYCFLVACAFFSISLCQYLISYLFLSFRYHIFDIYYYVPITQSILLLVLITYVNNDNRNKMHFGYWEHQFPHTNNVGSWGVLTNHFEMPLQVLLFKIE